MRKPLIAGNWKMYKTPRESLAFLSEFLPLMRDHHAHDITIFPTMSSLAYVIEAVKGTNVSAGAQTMHWLNEGPYTGQTSPTMLASIDCNHVLLGHSERRIYANETDDMVNWKLKAALEHNLVPIVCVGESLDKRQAGLTEAVLNWQIACALNGIHEEYAAPIIIAYEPIWAIGTGLTPSEADVAAIHRDIRKALVERLGKAGAEMRILYGGSVKAENAAGLMAVPEVGGALVGGASLQAEAFLSIAQAAAHQG